MDFEHHCQVFIGDCIPNSWVIRTFKQPLLMGYYGGILVEDQRDIT